MKSQQAPKAPDPMNQRKNYVLFSNGKPVPNIILYLYTADMAYWYKLGYSLALKGA